MPAINKTATTKAAAAKKTTKAKVTKAAAAKKAADPNKLGKPLVRILTTLAKNKAPLTRAQISEKAGVDHAFLSTYLGAHDPDVRKANEAKRGTTGLITRGLVKADEDDRDGRTVVVYVITAAGRAALAKQA
jgi:hypothetical protein